MTFVGTGGGADVGGLGMNTAKQHSNVTGTGMRITSYDWSLNVAIKWTEEKKEMDEKWMEMEIDKDNGKGLQGNGKQRERGRKC